MKLNERLIKWYQGNKRTLPWRSTREPYKIWVSEIILQQTRVIQGMDYYERFIERFPDIGKLSESKIDDIMKIWQGLGYYSRARNMHVAAQQVMDRFGGVFPDNYNAIKSLKGIGTYTAAAISSICFNERRAVVDGNVLRVISRIEAIEEPVDTARGKKMVSEYAQLFLHETDPGTHNQAIMELGALVCLPRDPACEKCPVKSNCKAYKKSLVKNIPVKSKKIKIRERYFYYLVIYNKQQIYLTQRNERDIWHSLYQFPLIELPAASSKNELMKKQKWKDMFNTSVLKLINWSGTFRHVLTHQVIHAEFITLQVEDGFKPPTNFMAVDPEEIGKYPVPRLIEIYIDNNEIIIPEN
ncbi:MAG: A/G-specific adenine glycosylase [Bacteroidota bacterium]